MMNKFIRYLMVGGINFTVCVGVMALLAWLGMHYTLYTTFGYGIAFLVSFALNLRFTFQASGRLKKRFSRFLAINLTNLLIVQAIQAFLIEIIHTRHVLAIITGMLWYTVVGFFMNQHFVFNHRLTSKTACQQ